MNNADERYRIRPSVSWCDIPDAHMACSKLGRFVAARNRICQAGLKYLIKGSVERRRRKRFVPDNILKGLRDS
jgi:hypothetical protein